MSNLWDRLHKLKFLTWNSAAKDMKVKIGSDVLIVKATTSLFARLLLIARSDRENVDLEEVIGQHEFANTNRHLMQPDGSIYPTNDKSNVIQLLKDLFHSDKASTEESTHGSSKACLVLDAM